MPVAPRIVPCLWFDGQAEPAAQYYIDIFPNSRIVEVSRYGETGRDIHGHEPGSVLTVEFELDGQPVTALNGGPQFRFNEAVSLQVFCDTQEEVDHFWDRLGEGGDPSAQNCGWLRDRYGVTWQVVPRRTLELVGDPDDPRARRAMEALMGMTKLDIAALERAYRGE